MKQSGRNLSTGALLALGVADLVILNLWAYPRTSLARRPQPQPSPAVAVDRPAPAERPRAPEETSAVPAAGPPVESAAPAPAAELTELRRVGPMVRIYFAHNQHTLAPDAAQQLAALGRGRAGAAAIARVVIEGHADRTGVEVYNSWLSEQRAEAVAGALAALGIDRQRMVVRAYGSSRPLAGGDETRALRRNRRVEIAVFGEVKREP